MQKQGEEGGETHTIHCAMICDTPAIVLFMAVAIAIVAIDGTLQVTL